MFAKQDKKDIPSWLEEEDDETDQLLRTCNSNSSSHHHNNNTVEEDYGNVILASSTKKYTSRVEIETSAAPSKNNSNNNNNEKTPLVTSLPKQQQHKKHPNSKKSSTKNLNSQKPRHTKYPTIGTKISTKTVHSQRPRRNCCHAIFILIHIIAVLSSSCMMTCQLVPIFFLELNDLQKILRIYIAIFCVMLILAEVEPSFLLPLVGNNFQHLDSFMFRGFLYTFLGVIGMEQAVNESTGVVLDDELLDKHKNANHEDRWIDYYDEYALTFMKGSSWLITCVGSLYVVMGAFCMRRLRDRCRESYTQRVIKYQAAKLEGNW